MRHFIEILIFTFLALNIKLKQISIFKAMKGATEAVEKLVDSALKFEFTAQQTEDDRMAVFTDDYVSPNYNKPAVVRMRKESEF